MKKKLFITRKFPAQIVEPLREYYDISQWDEEEMVIPRDKLLAAVADCEVLWVTLADQVNEELLSHAPNLKLVTNLAVGYNNIDVQALRKRGVMATNTPGVLTNTTADLVMGLLLATARRIPESERYLREGKWKSWYPMQLVGKDVSGATIGIIGMGRIGQAVARRAKGFDMKVLYNNRRRRHEAEEMYGFQYASLEELLKQSDFVVIMTPYNNDTEGLIGAEELALMKDDAVIINASRGGIIDELALYDTLKEGKLWAAGLDVFEQEPIAMDHPLLTLSNVVALPHIGSASLETRTAMLMLNVKELTAYGQGKAVTNRID
ncbi:D-glycerate dehydrogenase [Lysinibacillus macroides]|uniref:Glyoxylate/hydroxypyruvate reductase B n=1 Tax=Lysinibacillus macroides TaxID=33935 RepID=A0A0N1J0D9_9BACI|nr:D-glycerate dehydrogenase [Lysinibacillus macroides]KOY84091.1 2-ketogluconate reductase [Lysinibacillus macroides]QPR66860.1 D-glycerate dehydrogenase [Lysinibacillus macroides]